jgi:hypothetical protein
VGVFLDQRPLSTKLLRDLLLHGIGTRSVLQVKGG